jgi:solute carrier family 25 S-adenosylmethionine transporter 26
MRAGGLAGSFATALLFPVDTIKTQRQSSNPKTALKGLSLLRVLSTTSLGKLYSGLLPATAGSFLSSSIYFGSYETAKRVLFAGCAPLLSRPSIHMLAAASGNLASSILFVPKDVLKQRLQMVGTSKISALPAVVRQVYRTQGLKGFYPSYRVTLLRNIPSAVLRFTVYEELRLLVLRARFDPRITAVGYLVAGSMASSLSSICTTPLDVVKTRLATGEIPAGTPILQCLQAVAQRGELFAGLQERLLLSALFGGVGLSAFEHFKQRLGIRDKEPLLLDSQRKK